MSDITYKPGRKPHPKETRRIFKNIDREGYDPSIKCFIKDGGYKTLKKVLKMEPADVINEVKKSGCCGFADNEIYSLAVHYYDEDDITIGSPINCRVVVNHNVELTEEEKKEAHRKAVEQYQQEEIKKMRDRNSKPKAKVESTALPSLFD